MVKHYCKDTVGSSCVQQMTLKHDISFYPGCFIILNINLKQLKLKTEFSSIDIFSPSQSKDHSLECFTNDSRGSCSQWLIFFFFFFTPWFKWHCFWLKAWITYVIHLGHVFVSKGKKKQKQAHIKSWMNCTHKSKQHLNLRWNVRGEKNKVWMKAREKESKQ